MLIFRFIIYKPVNYIKQQTILYSYAERIVNSYTRRENALRVLLYRSIKSEAEKEKTNQNVVIEKPKELPNDGAEAKE